MSRVQDLERELQLAKAEEAFAEVKALWAAGEISREKYEKAAGKVRAARVRQRLGQGRAGSERYRVEEDGTVVALKVQKIRQNVRDEDGNKTGEKIEHEEVIERVVGK